MKKILPILLFFIICIFLLSNSLEIINSIRSSYIICINNLFPSIFTFLLISNIVMEYNFIDKFNILFKPLMNKLFKVNEHCSFIFIMSMISGSPSSAKYIKYIYEKKLINDYDVIKCLNFCQFVNPIFIIGTIGELLLKNRKLSFIILISHYLSNIIMGIINRNKFPFIKIKTKENNNINYNFMSILSKSIKDTINTLLLILGVITTCLIITTLIFNNINVDNVLIDFIKGLFEITQGINFINQRNINQNIKTILYSFLVSFGGISIHLQTLSILENKKIRYIPYLKSRLISAILSSVLTFIMLLY